MGVANSPDKKLDQSFGPCFSSLTTSGELNNSTIASTLVRISFLWSKVRYFAYLGWRSCRRFPVSTNNVYTSNARLTLMRNADAKVTKTA
jgi:hypothetical protein